jgi:TP901 family phage tail tape measure protein
MFGLGSNTQLGIGIAISLHNQFSREASNINNQLLNMKRNAKDAITGVAQEYRARQAAIAAGGAAISYGMFKMAESGAKFDHTIRQSLIMGGKGFGQTKQQLEGIADQLSKTYLGKPQEIAEVMLANARAGVRTEMKKVTEYQIASASAVGENIDAVSNALLGGLHSYGFNIKDFDLVANTMVAAANSSAASVEDLGHSLEYAGFTAKRLNIPFQDLNIMMGMLAQKQIRGSSAGTGLNNFFLQLARSVDVFATPSQQKAWKAIGVNTKIIRDLVNSGKTMEALMYMGKATAGMDPTLKVSTFTKLLNLRGDRGAAGIVQGLFGSGNDWMQSEFRRMRTEIYGGQPNNIAIQQGKKMMESPYGQLQLFYQSIDRFKIAFFKGVLPVFTQMINIARHVVEGMIWFGKTPLGKALLSLTAIAAPLVTALAAFKVAALTLAFAMKNWSNIAGMGGFRNLMGGLLGMGGTSGVIGMAGGAIGRNKAGRLYVKGGNTVSLNGRNYTGGRMLPGSLSGPILINGSAMSMGGTWGKVGKFLGPLLPAVKGIGTAFGRFLPILGWGLTLWSIYDVLKGIWGQGEEKKRDSAVSQIDALYYKHLDAQLTGHYMSTDWYKNTGKTTWQKPNLNQQINVIVDNKNVLSQAIPAILDQTMDSQLNFEVPGGF